MLELNLYARNGRRRLLLKLLVQLKILRLPPLVRLRPLDGGHERVRNRRVVCELGRRDSVQRHAKTQLQRLELQPRRVRRVPRARAGVPEQRRRQRQHRRHGVQRRRLGMPPPSRHPHRLVQRVRRLGRQALPG